MKLYISYLIALLCTSVYLSYGDLVICEDEAIPADELQGNTIIRLPTQQAGNINCTLAITGLPRHTWVQLKVGSSKSDLNCSRNYVSLNGRGPSCKNKQKTIIYYYNTSGTALIQFYADNFQPAISFSLRFRVARVVHTKSASNNEVFINKSQQWFIVSHADYLLHQYDPNINSSLTFHVIKPSSFDIKSQKFRLNNSQPCADHLLITEGNVTDKFCANNGSGHLQKSFRVTRNMVTLNFVTDGSKAARGFLLSYNITVEDSSITTSSAREDNFTTVGKEPGELSKMVYAGIGTAAGAVIIIALTVAGVVLVRKRTRKPTSNENNSERNQNELQSDVDTRSPEVCQPAEDHDYNASNYYGNAESGGQEYLDVQYLNTHQLTRRSCPEEEMAEGGNIYHVVDSHSLPSPVTPPAIEIASTSIVDGNDKTTPVNVNLADRTDKVYSSPLEDESRQVVARPAQESNYLNVYTPNNMNNEQIDLIDNSLYGT